MTKSNTEASSAAIIEDLNFRAARLAPALFRVHASEAGCVLSVPENGEDIGIDFTVRKRGNQSETEEGWKAGRAMCDVQVKSVREGSDGLRKLRNGSYSYRLDRKTYNGLCSEDTTIPRVLFVVVLPSSPPWFKVADNKSTINGTQFLVSLRGSSPTIRAKKVVHLTKDNQMDTKAFQQFLRSI